MRILKIHLIHLRNNGHNQFLSEVTGLMDVYPAVRLKMQHVYEQFSAACEQEDALLTRIRKSFITEEIETANRSRNTVFRGMADGNASALNHFLPEVAAAARRIQIVLDTYGNLSRLPVDEETSALGNLLAELDKNYPADMEKTGLAEWSKELKRRNSVLDELVQNRYIETAGRTDPSMKMKDARAEAEEAYRVLALCLEALWHLAVNGEEKEPFAQCIRLLNAIIRHYNTVLAQGKGHGKNDGNSNDDDTDQSPAIVEGNL